VADILAVEAGKKPEEKTEGDAEKQASDNRKVKGGVLPAVNDVARELAEAEGQFAIEVEKCADSNEYRTQGEESAAKFTKGFHIGILREAADKPKANRAKRSFLLLVHTYH